MTHATCRFIVHSCLLAMFLLAGHASAQDPPASMPGTVAGVGTRFEISDSDYLNLVVETSDVVSVRLSSIPDVILLDIETADGATSTQVSVSGLPPLSVMHRYLDTLANHEAMTVDETGRIAWTQDLAQPHFVIMKPTESTIFLDLNGWSDPTVGTWDPATFTGTLTRDVTETIEISARVRLDGAGHSVTTDRGIGVYIKERIEPPKPPAPVPPAPQPGDPPPPPAPQPPPGVTVQNLILLNPVTGIVARDVRELSLSHNIIEVGYAGFGVDCRSVGFLRIKENTVRAYSALPNSYKYGLFFEKGQGTCESNSVTGADLAFWLHGCSADTLKYNTITGPGSSFFLESCSNVLVFNNYSMGPKPFASVSGGSGILFYLDPPIGGNYWSSWTTPDENRDGFVDKAYEFSKGYDLYPLTTPEPRYFAILASASVGGSITPSGSVQVLPGASQRFDFMPDVCYQARSLSIDPGPKPWPGPDPIKELVLNYTFTNVWKSHTIAVGFAEGNRIPRPTITGPASGAIFAVGQPVPLTGHFEDVEIPAQTHTAQWTCDGLAVPGVVDENSGAVTASHAFTAAGVYLVSLTVADQCGGSATTTTMEDGLDAMIVVYDPNAGFVTGGGWIQSPPGAYGPDPALVGKANFGFVSKYLKGKSIPTGETEFQFKVADLNFHSVSYDWLVISGSKSQYKGWGTIKGTGDYGFMLTAIDGDLKGARQPDRFRIRITDRVTGALVYDNQLSAPDGDDPTTALGGGSIVIHSTSGGTGTLAALETPGASTPSPPTAYALFPNRPNPFQANTTIGFDLPEAGHVNLVVFSVAGRVVSTLAKEEWPAGRHELVWSGEGDDGVRAAAGVYFYRITVQPTRGGASFTSLRRTVFLR